MHGAQPAAPVRLIGASFTLDVRGGYYHPDRTDQCMENNMLPIVDYGGIAIVIPKIAAVGSVVEDNGKFGFEVYLAGMNEPVVIGFTTTEEAAESRNELIAIIAQFHYERELGPDYEIDDIVEEDVAEADDSEENEKH